MQYEKAVVFYERLDRDSPSFKKLRLVFEDGSELVVKFGEFKITDEYEMNPDPNSDPMRITARWDQEDTTPPQIVDLVGSQTASDEFWEHIWPSGDDNAVEF